MSYKTVEVELENGVVHPAGSETLPAKAHALLTILSLTASTPSDPAAAGRNGIALACAELADRVGSWAKLPPDEGNAFADDIEAARRNLPPLKSKWD